MPLLSSKSFVFYVIPITPKTKIYKELQFYMFYLGLRLGLSLWGKNIQLQVFENKVLKIYA
jgi:hypothetical protein